MRKLTYNPACEDCRRANHPVQIEQTRRGGEWRVKIEGRIVAHAKNHKDAKKLLRFLRIGVDQFGLGW